MGILCLFYYLCKYDLGPATAGIQEEFRFTNKTFGFVTTIFTLTYAGGQFINGFLLHQMYLSTAHRTTVEQ